MILSFAYCNVAVAPVRSEPSHTSEQINQLLFGDKLEILELENIDWVKIRSTWDDYEGWCKQSQVKELQKKDYRKAAKYLVGNHSSRIVFDDSSEMILPYGAELSGMKGIDIAPVGPVGYFKGKKLNRMEMVLDGEQLKAAALQYMHTPYLWGGKTVLGIDCSGLTQMVYKLCGYALPRDASQQAKTGNLVDFLPNARCGDLAFFDNKEGRINHVGMLLDSQTIIHATDTTGRVVIDRIDQAGIISTTLKRRTHNLRVVKRIAD